MDLPSSSTKILAHYFRSCLWIGFALVITTCLGASAEGKTIKLRTRSIETDAALPRTVASPLLSRVSQADVTTESDNRAAYLIQFSEKITEADRSRLSAIDAAIVRYIPDDAMIVLLNPAKKTTLSAINGVRWLGTYEAEDKVSPDLKLIQQSMVDDLDDVEVVISVLRPGDLDAVSAVVNNAGGSVVTTGRGSRWATVRARVSASALDELASLAEVEWIELFLQPKLMNNVAVDGARMNVRPVWTNHNLRGSGQIIGVGDTGLDTGNLTTMHPDFTNRIQAAFGLVSASDWSDHGGHGTHVAGSVLGNGSAYSNGLFSGVAPEAKLVMQSIGGVTSGDDSVYPPSPLNTMFEQARSAGARIHTDSWGSSAAGAYTTDSRELDEFMWDYDDMLVLFSAGNEGRDTNPTNGVIDGNSIGAPGTAKNCLTVGAAESARPAGSGGYSSYPWGVGSWLPYYSALPIRTDLISTSADGLHQGMAGFSSRGPCADGRTKPDIVAPGTDIISCRSRVSGASTLWGTGSGVLANGAASSFYTFSGGTSMSTPLTAGAAGLARQYLVDTEGMESPSAALLKALLVNGARSLFPGQYGTGIYQEIPNGARPNNVEGWGHVNLENSLFPASGRKNIFWDRQQLGTGQTNYYPVVVTGTNELNITLSWSDYPASLAASQQLVNDLDLRLISPSGAIRYPHGAAQADHLNNLEGIDVASPELGTNWIEVVGYNVPEGPQKFALMAKCTGDALPLVQIYGVWVEPTPVYNTEAAHVFATLSPGSLGLMAAAVAYRVDGGSWSYQTLQLDSHGGETDTYVGTFPLFAAGSAVDYYVYAVSYDLSSDYSATNSFNIESSTVYVKPTGTPQWPYDNWNRAFTNIQQAVDYVGTDCTIVVTNGTYSGNTLTVAKSITLESVNGPESTIISGSDARRCAYITSTATLRGFTFANGFSSGSGGAVYLAAGTLASCVIRDSFSYNHGGGLNLVDGTVIDSIIYWNQAYYYGGGLIQRGGTLINSIVCDNYSGSDGGGMEFWGGESINCTFANNEAGGYGGGFDLGGEGFTINNIIYGNTAADGINWYKWLDEGLYYSCTSPNPGDEGSFDADPLFADPNTRDYHLQSQAGRFVSVGVWTTDPVSSPCIDTGYVPLDFSNEPTPNGRRINIGAYGNTDEASKGSSAIGPIADPKQGPFSGGNSIWIYGIESNEIASITVDGTPTTIQYLGYTWAIATLPALGYAGPVDLAVQTVNNGTIIGTDAYTYNPQGQITNIQPASVSWQGGTTVTIKGTNLGNGADIYNVSLAGVTVTSISSQSSNQVVVVAAASATTGTGEAHVYSSSFGETIKTNAFTYAKTSQTISFAQIPAHLSTDVVTLSATATPSGLPVTFSVLSGPAAITNGTTLKFTGAGLVKIVANQSGNVLWSAAPEVTNSFTVTQAYSFRIQSPYGTTTPATGLYAYATGSLLTNSVSTPVTLGATQYVCTGWSMVGNAPTTGNTPQAILTLTNNAVLTWLWATNYSLTTAAGTAGSVTVGSGWMRAGVTTQITAVASAYYHFANWTGTVSSSINPLSLLMSAPQSVTANFAANITVNNPTPEWWMAQFGITSDFETAVLNDPDGDGASTGDEWIMDTNPTNHQSILQVSQTEFLYDTNGHVVGQRLVWPCSLGRVYDVQHTASLNNDVWVALGSLTNLVPTQSPMTVTNTIISPDAQFIRLKVRLP